MKKFRVIKYDGKYLAAEISPHDTNWYIYKFDSEWRTTILKNFAKRHWTQRGAEKTIDLYHEIIVKTVEKK